MRGLVPQTFLDSPDQIRAFAPAGPLLADLGLPALAFELTLPRCHPIRTHPAPAALVPAPDGRLELLYWLRLRGLPLDHGALARLWLDLVPEVEKAALDVLSNDFYQGDGAPTRAMVLLAPGALVVAHDDLLEDAAETVLALIDDRPEDADEATLSMRAALHLVTCGPETGHGRLAHTATDRSALDLVYRWAIAPGVDPEVLDGLDVDPG